MSTASELRYEDAPRYATAAIAGVIGFLFFVDLLLALLIPEIFWVMLVTMVFELALFYFIIPRKYQIFNDRVRIVLGGPIKIDLPFSTIREARPARGQEAFVYWGLRMATSGEGVVEIARRGGGLDVVISPRDRDTFLEQLDLALQVSSQSKAAPPKWRTV